MLGDVLYMLHLTCYLKLTTYVKSYKFKIIFYDYNFTPLLWFYLKVKFPILTTKSLVSLGKNEVPSSNCFCPFTYFGLLQISSRDLEWININGVFMNLSVSFCFFSLLGERAMWSWGRLSHITCTLKLKRYPGRDGLKPSPPVITWTPFLRQFCLYFKVPKQTFSRQFGS